MRWTEVSAEEVTTPPLHIKYKKTEQRIPITQEAINERRERITKSLKDRETRLREQAARHALLKRTRRLLRSDLRVTASHTTQIPHN
ncbi:hypothetical protein AOQ84DRAFT_353120 [Glonium stellatum]|uniref:Uncharacterized protein n=1 Tax=Glonium stellatum TaxID=574774 RepID=A0A8E2JVM3_9PEZI|nr:hypothetical protein AOQ84DRAFT_353120 [Glonium stellatum]